MVYNSHFNSFDANMDGKKEAEFVWEVNFSKNFEHQDSVIR